MSKKPFLDNLTMPSLTKSITHRAKRLLPPLPSLLRTILFSNFAAFIPKPLLPSFLATFLIAIRSF